ncbi:DNA repair protein RadC [Agathobaculum sp. NSJ-28]|uniref:DNA repair protein RadC n=2 Tax=Agathobaculum TaxID=2048137 RepID=A0A923RWF5_9FIRM|nr:MULTISPECIES: DNA repair protein RadC [Butyricicoccaceae]MBS6882316.1 DNA repair protein RadC [Clostridiaceae bacterium]SCJ07387.1 DNA repair protein RadC [uncultured Butyricicoccus sp.]MBC5725938.1 DNA repair protein RadC [Agathobaculum faecis]MCU6789161.1 DNA repair protein RadC [Agathobaculum ammoniilyticum]WOC74295.1 DNA repair protein RadC [Intestinibacillus sp. NTUH-41-i26]
MEPNLHENHRQRVWEKFRRFGLQVFADHEVLELLLFFAIRRGDTNPTAHALLKRFGSLHAVLEAPPEELQKVKGVGPHTASLIKVAFALVGRYQADVAKMEANGDKLNSSERIGAFFVPQFMGESEEVLIAAYVDGAGRVIKCEEAGRGGRAQVRVDCGKICRNALLSEAAGVAIAHNHPNGRALPSHEDIEVTRMLERYLNDMDIELLDHCIVARGKYYSMRKQLLIGQERR